jgi:hypothetical protein
MSFSILCKLVTPSSARSRFTFAQKERWFYHSRISVPFVHNPKILRLNPTPRAYRSYCFAFRHLQGNDSSSGIEPFTHFGKSEWKGFQDFSASDLQSPDNGHSTGFACPGTNPSAGNSILMSHGRISMRQRSCQCDRLSIVEANRDNPSY